MAIGRISPITRPVDIYYTLVAPLDLLSIMVFLKKQCMTTVGDLARENQRKANTNSQTCKFSHSVHIRYSRSLFGVNHCVQDSTAVKAREIRQKIVDKNHACFGNFLLVAACLPKTMTRTHQPQEFNIVCCAKGDKFGIVVDIYAKQQVQRVDERCIHNGY